MSRRKHSQVLRTYQIQLEAVYRTRAPDIRRFAIDSQQVSDLLPAARPTDEWVLVREDQGELQVAVHVSDHLLDNLASAGSPAAGLDADFQAFCATVEGVSHYLLLMERASRGEPLSLLELEAQAEVDKFVCAHLNAPHRSQEWRSRLFRRAALADGLSADEYDRYREAGRLAEAWCKHLDGLPHQAAILTVQRRFWRESGAQRMDQLRRRAA